MQKEINILKSRVLALSLAGVVVVGLILSAVFGGINNNSEAGLTASIKSIGAIKKPVPALSDSALKGNVVDVNQNANSAIRRLAIVAFQTKIMELTNAVRRYDAGSILLSPCGAERTVELNNSFSLANEALINLNRVFVGENNMVSENDQAVWESSFNSNIDRINEQLNIAGYNISMAEGLIRVMLASPTSSCSVEMPQQVKNYLFEGYQNPQGSALIRKLQEVNAAYSSLVSSN